MYRAEEALASAHILDNRMFNSAISEAYYSMFYSAKALLSLKNFHPKKHRGVLRLLGKELVSKGYIEEVYGKIFAKDMELRKKADHDISFKASREEAESVIDDAERFLERIRKAIEALKGKGS
ncbi:MAG: HEPN domain-containing protein [Candidatus Freyarchaeota archaeon]